MSRSRPPRKKAIKVSDAILICTFLVVIILAFVLSAVLGQRVSVNAWLTTADLNTHLAQQPDLTFSSGQSTSSNILTINENQKYQQMDGFGASFTDASAWLVYDKMSSSQRAALMNNLFSASNGIGLGEMVYSMAWCSPIHTVLKPPFSAIRVSSVRSSNSWRWLTCSSQRSMCTNNENFMGLSSKLGSVACRGRRQVSRRMPGHPSYKG